MIPGFTLVYEVVGMVNMTELTTVSAGKLQLGSVVRSGLSWDKLLDEIVRDIDGLSYEIVIK